MRIGLTSTLPRAAAAALLLLLASPYAAEAIGVATPEEMNMDSEPLAKIADDLRDQVAYGQLAGAAFQVYRCVGVGVACACGWSGWEGTRVWVGRPRAEAVGGTARRSSVGGAGIPPARFSNGGSRISTHP